MRRLGMNVARLHALRKTLADTSIGSRLSPLGGFGANPGALAGHVYIPNGLAPGAALVVVLHGCTQNSALYDRGSGWSQLADRHGFALLFPEQGRSNNHNLCFNWYAAGDARRGRGEAASIAGMIRHTTATFELDPSRVYINGLSAGGAMSAVMLACYPELFAGGAIIAGLPFGVAEGVGQALERMRGQDMPSRATLANRIGAAAKGHRGGWPTLSVWHGNADTLVVPANAAATVDQWRDRVGLGESSGSVDSLEGHRRTTWRDAAGQSAIELIEVAGMGHGIPICARGPDGYGTAGPHFLDAGICSTRHLAKRWGLASALVQKPAQSITRPAQETSRAKREAMPLASGVGGIIEDALRAAGLMR